MSAAAPAEEILQSAPPRPRVYAFLVAASAAAALLGFAREAAVGALFGASRATDAFYAALALPFLAAYFIAGGALAPPLTAAVASRLVRGDEEGARGVLASALRVTTLAGIAACAATAMLAAPIARLLAPGFDASSAALLARLLRVLVVYGLLTSLALLGSAALLAAGAYAAPALSALLGNAVALGVLLALGRRGIEAAALALVAGSAASLATVALPLARHRLLALAAPGRPLPWRDSALLVLSLAASGGVDLLERPFASTVGVGAVAILAFASKLVHLPMRLVAAPLTSVSFPRFVRNARAVEASETASVVLRALSYAAAVAGGAAAPLVALAFGRGRFDAFALAQLASALAVLAPAIVAIGFLEVGARYLLAAGRARSVLIAHACGLGVYAVAAPLLVAHGVLGLAVARDLSWGTAALGLGLPLALRGTVAGRDALASLLAALAAAPAAALVCHELDLPSGPLLLVSALAAAAVFSAVLFLARARRAA